MSSVILETGTRQRPSLREIRAGNAQRFSTSCGDNMTAAACVTLGLGTPSRDRTNEIRIRGIIEQRYEFQRMAIGITEVNLRRWHPSNHRWLSRSLAEEVLTLDAQAFKSFASSAKLRQRHSDSKMALVEIAAIGGAWSPKPEHRPSVATDPEEDDIARPVAKGKL